MDMWHKSAKGKVEDVDDAGEAKAEWGTCRTKWSSAEGMQSKTEQSESRTEQSNEKESMAGTTQSRAKQDGAEQSTGRHRTEKEGAKKKILEHCGARR